MASFRPLLAVALGLGLLTMAAWGGPVELLLTSFGVEPDAVALVSPTVAVVLGAGGFVLFAIGLVQTFQSTVRGAAAEPYVAALRPFAAEFGRGVTREGPRLHLELQRDTQRLAITVDLGPAASVAIESPSPARQALGWVRHGAPRPAAAANWRVVEGSDGVDFVAELPVMARPVMADAPTVACVRRLFEYPEAVSIVHGLGGIRVEATLPPAERVSGVVRQAVEVAFRLRQVNG